MSNHTMSTTMGEALQRAGFNTDEYRLRQAGFDALAKHHRNIDRALPTFHRLVGDDPALIREALRFYLTAQARDAANELSGGGRLLFDAHALHASSRQPSGDSTGQLNSVDHHKSADASPDGAGRDNCATQVQSARPVREPSASQRAAASAVAKSLAITVLDTYRVRDGRAIGDVRFGELERMRGANAMEAAIIRQIQRRYAHAQHDARVRDLVKAEDLNKMMQIGAEVADAS